MAVSFLLSVQLERITFWLITRVVSRGCDKRPVETPGGLIKARRNGEPSPTPQDGLAAPPLPDSAEQ